MESLIRVDNIELQRFKYDDGVVEYALVKNSQGSAVLLTKDELSGLQLWLKNNEDVILGN